MLDRSTHRRRRAGAPMQNLAHSASLQSDEKSAPSKPGTKHLGYAPAIREGLVASVLLHVSQGAIHGSHKARVIEVEADAQRLWIVRNLSENAQPWGLPGKPRRNG